MFLIIIKTHKHYETFNVQKGGVVIKVPVSRRTKANLDRSSFLVIFVWDNVEDLKYFGETNQTKEMRLNTKHV